MLAVKRGRAGLECRVNDESRASRVISGIGEDGLLAELVAGLASKEDVVVGPGDDCAVLRLGGSKWLWTTDSQIEGTHFRRGWMTPYQLGRRSYLVNASDIAAMGGQPSYCLVSITAPASTSTNDFVEIQRGVAAAARADDVSIVGGNIAGATHLAVTLALIGRAPKRPLLRSGARPGDGIYVTGLLGEAALGLERLRAEGYGRSMVVKRFREPRPRLRAGALLAERRIASAAMDISDGLMSDLPRLCRASGVGAEIVVDQLPCSKAVRRKGRALALTGGEDYELLCAVPAKKETRLVKMLDELECGMTRIGVCTEESGKVVVRDGSGHEVPCEGGFSHFTAPRKQV